jgi:hypothetical protein
MEKKIGKRFLKGIAASPGIAIGAVCVLQDIFLLVERRRTGDRPLRRGGHTFHTGGTSGELMEAYGNRLRSVARKALELSTATEIVRLVGAHEGCSAHTTTY